jgi:hypothetical protein
MKYNVGDKVQVKNFDRPYNGCVGDIVAINGEYHIVRVQIERVEVEHHTIECYRNELDLLVDILDVHKNNFQEDLFKL